MNLKDFWAIALLLASAAAIAQDSSVPKYVQLARELVATVKPENNHYGYFANKATGVQWKDEGYPENTVDTACGGLVSAVFEKAGSTLIEKIRIQSNQRKLLKSKPYVMHIHGWIQAANNGYGLAQIRSLNDVKVGDLFIFECKLGSCKTSQGDVEGHISIIDQTPIKHTSVFGDGLEWEVTVIDSADNPHGPDDTRYSGRGVKGNTGVGRGTYRVVSDQNGIPTGYFLGKAIVDIASRPITFSRPQF